MIKCLYWFTLLKTHRFLQGRLARTHIKWRSSGLWLLNSKRTGKSSENRTTSSWPDYLITFVSASLFKTHSVNKTTITITNSMSQFFNFPQTCQQMIPTCNYQTCLTSGIRGGGGGGRELLNKVSYGDALPRGPTHYPSIYHFWQKRCPFRTLSVDS